MVGEVERQPRGVRLRERYGLVLSLILVSYLLAGFEENLLMILVNSLLWGTLLLATLWSPGLPATLRRVGVEGLKVTVWESSWSFASYQESFDSVPGC